MAVVFLRDGVEERLYWAYDVPTRRDGGRSVWLRRGLAQHISREAAERLVARARQRFELAREAVENRDCQLVGIEVEAVR